MSSNVLDTVTKYNGTFHSLSQLGCVKIGSLFGAIIKFFLQPSDLLNLGLFSEVPY